MTVTKFVLGPLDNNAYVVTGNEKTCIIIDAPLTIEPLMEFISSNKLTPAAILLTHGHFDHTGGLKDLKKLYNIPVYIHREDSEYLCNPELNGSLYFGFPDKSVPADNFLEEGKIISFADIKINVLHTPGHTPGGCCFLIDDTLFSGDTLFCMGVGRTDLIGGSEEQLLNSIVLKLFPLPLNIKVLSGHGAETTILKEKKGNPFIDYLKSCG